MSDATWHKVSKFYKGGSSEFQIAVPKSVRLSRSDWETILEWLGENTTGGRAYGYSIKSRRLRNKSATLRVVRYPSGLCPALFGYGTEVKTSRKMI